MALRRRSPLAPIVLLSLGAAALIAPACRLGYEELDVTDGMLSGGDGNADAGTSSGNASNTGGVPDGGAPGSGGSSVNGGSSTNGGSSVNGGTNTGGTSGGTAGGTTNGGTGGTLVGAGGEAGITGMPAGGEGGSGTACVGTVDCTCDTFNGHEYLFCRQALARDAANTYCQTNGMTLVRIDNATENDFVLTKGTAYSVFVTPLFFTFIGANDQAVLGEWRWVDGALFWQGGTGGTLVQGMYASWDNKSPGTMSVQRCAGMLATGLWQDRSCTALNTFVCESP